MVDIRPVLYQQGQLKLMALKLQFQRRALYPALFQTAPRYGQKNKSILASPKP